MRAIRAGALYFVSVFAVGFALGAVRVSILAPRLGDFGAVLVETPFILTASWFLCRLWVRRFSVSPNTGSRILMGVEALALLLIAETLLSYFAFGLNLDDQLMRYSTPAGIAGLVGQIVFASFPLLQLAFEKQR